MVAVANAAQPAAPLRIAVAYAPKTLSPSLATDAAAARLLQLTHPALLEWGPGYQPVGRVAQGCTQPAPTTVQCTLRPGLPYTNGRPVTAGSIKLWLEQLQANPRSPLATPLKGVTITSPTPQTLTFTLPQPTLTFLATLVDIPLADPAAPGHGAGPYQLQQLDALGNVTLTTRQPGLPPALEFLYVPDATTRMLKLKKGEVDVVLDDLTPELFTWAKSHGYAATATPGTSYTYLGFNFNNRYLSNPAVRQAIALALNRPQLRRYLLAGLAAPAGSLLPPGHPAAWEAPEEPTDPFTAEGLLDEAYLMQGPDGSRFTLTLLTSTDGFIQRLSQAIRQQLEAVGIAVRLRPTEWASFYDAVKKGQFDMVLLTWTGEQQPAFYHSVFNSTQVPPVGFNRGRFKNTTVDALTSQILTSPTPQAQIETTLHLQHLLADIRPYLPLYRRAHTLVSQPNVTGCSVPPSGAYTGLLTCRRP